MHPAFVTVFTLLSCATASMEAFFVRLEIAGDAVPENSAFTLRVEPNWAPLGAARFRELVEDKFYDDQRFFRVLDGMYDIWIAQFGNVGGPVPS